MPSLFRQTLTKDQLLTKRGDLSQFLVHLTRTGKYKQWHDIYGLSKDNFLILNAKQSLETILRNTQIEARSPFGYFNYKVPYSGAILNSASKVQRAWLRSVCFTETPVDFVSLQFQEIYGRQLQFEPYGLAFFEESVRLKGGNPVFYFDSRNTQIAAAMDAITVLPNCQSFAPFMALVETFGPPVYKNATKAKEIDFRWEREWRKPGNFDFTKADVAFGFCPTAEIPYFEGLVGKSFPFVDPNDSTVNIKATLRKWPTLKNLK